MSFKIVQCLWACLLCASAVTGLGSTMLPAAADTVSPITPLDGSDQQGAAESPQDTSAWKLHGSFSQFYHGVSSADAGGDQDYHSEVDTGLDLTAEQTAHDYQIQGRFIGGYSSRLMEDGSDPLHISSLYVDVADGDRRSEVRLGRQTPDRGGVLGPFDGLLLSRQLKPGLRLNLVGGFPMDGSTMNKVTTATHFYGVNADFGTFGQGWDFNAFAIEQVSEHLLDRRALGGQARYSRPGISLQGLMDYDASYRTLDLLMLMGSWQLPDRTTLNVTYDQRKSPILTTRNALIGQADTSLSALSQHYNEEQIRALARDRSADSRSYTIGAIHPLSERLQIGGDLSLSTLSATPASGGVAATAASDGNWSYSLQLMGKDLFKRGDGAIFGLGHEAHPGCDSWSLNLDNHYPISDAWQVNPVLHLDRQRLSGDRASQWSLLPALRVNYLMRRNLNLEVELGGERDIAATGNKATGYYLSVGYRALI